jgi:hypothetical protein
MVPQVAAQRKALDELAPTLDSLNTLLFDIVGPKCGGHSCGIDTVIAGTLNGQVAYPNDQLNVTTPNGEGTTGLWDSMFSEPGPSGATTGKTSTGASNCSSSGQCALNIVLSFHCDTIAQTLTQTLLGLFPPSVQLTIQQTCQTLTLHTTSAPVTPSPSQASYLAGLFG